MIGKILQLSHGARINYIILFQKFTHVTQPYKNKPFHSPLREIVNDAINNNTQTVNRDLSNNNSNQTNNINVKNIYYKNCYIVNK